MPAISPGSSAPSLKTRPTTGAWIGAITIPPSGLIFMSGSSPDNMPPELTALWI